MAPAQHRRVRSRCGPAGRLGALVLCLVLASVGLQLERVRSPGFASGGRPLDSAQLLAAATMAAAERLGEARERARAAALGGEDGGGGSGDWSGAHDRDLPVGGVGLAGTVTRRSGAPQLLVGAGVPAAAGAGASVASSAAAMLFGGSGALRSTTQMSAQPHRSCLPPTPDPSVLAARAAIRRLGIGRSCAALFPRAAGQSGGRLAEGAAGEAAANSLSDEARLCLLGRSLAARHGRAADRDRRGDRSGSDQRNGQSNGHGGADADEGFRGGHLLLVVGAGQRAASLALTLGSAIAALGGSGNGGGDGGGGGEGGFGPPLLALSLDPVAEAVAAALGISSFRPSDRFMADHGRPAAAAESGPTAPDRPDSAAASPGAPAAAGALAAAAAAHVLLRSGVTLVVSCGAPVLFAADPFAALESDSATSDSARSGGIASGGGSGASRWVSEADVAVLTAGWDEVGRAVRRARALFSLPFRPLCPACPSPVHPLVSSIVCVCLRLL